MKFYNIIMDYITSRISVNLLRVGLLLPAIFISSTTFAAEPVCAVVKIEIQQELTLERQAFDAVMRINNGLDLLSLENVNINVTFKDETGASVEATSDTNSTTAKFFIKVDSMSGIDNIDGTGTVAPKTTAEVHWLIIPAPGAGGASPSGKLYFVGASLNYNLGGELQTTTVTPDSIYVKPLPELQLDYFLEKDVHADDPFTTEIEPAIPFTLGVRVKNNGAASATGLKIDSAQPTIVENEQGLKIGFNIIGSNVNELPSTNSLLIDFGEIKPNEATMGRWDMVTTLSGRFTEFTADFSHADDLGGRLTSIIDPQGIKTHFLSRNVRVDLPGRDFVRDFLAYDDPVNPVYRVYESSGLDSDVADVSSSSTLSVVSSGTEPALNLTMPVTTGFSYAKFDDPFAGSKVVKQMVRSDGKAIPLDNVWLSKTRNLDNPNNPGWDYFINFFDANSTGTYAILMGEPDLGPVAPEFTPMGNVTTYETATVTFPVSATDANGDAVTLTAGTLPTGATFTSDTSGSGTFTWTPSVGQAGNYAISFTASDGTLSKQASVNIKVNPSWDTDGDGMDDAWEIQMFGDLSRDGTGDLDGDGISDLQEYLNNTDPNLVPPLVPTNLVALPGNAENTLSWDTVTGVDSYNVYWSLTSDVSPTKGTVLNSTTSPFVHSGLDNDVTYYYIVTSVGAGGESGPSNVVAVTTGVRDWTAPKVFSNAAGTYGQNVVIAMTANGDAIAVWQQTNIDISTIMASRYVVGTGWSIPVAISSTTLNASNPQISMDDSGNAIAVWQEGSVTQSDILAARYDATTGWEASVKIENDGANAAVNPQLVMSKTGDAIVVWQQGSSIYVNSYEASSWQTEALLADETNFTIAELKLAINQNGEGFAAWTVTQDQTVYDLRLSQLSSNTWSAPTSVTTGLDNATSTAISVNDSGSAVLAWTAFDGTRHNLMASEYTTTGGWSTPLAIGNAVGDAKSPQLVMDTSGNAYVTWTQSSSPYSVYVKRFDAALSWQTTDIIEQRQRGDAANPHLSLDARGNVVVTWQQDDGVQQNILAAVYDTSTSSWTEERVIETTNSGHATSPVIAMNDSGNAIVAWQQDNAGESVISTNHYEAGNSGIPNIAPIAVAGTEQSVNEETLVTLDGTGSFDQDGSGLVSSYSWVQTAGTTVTLTGATTATPSFNAPVVLETDGAQTLTFELTVTDDANATSSKTVNVVVNPVNAAPVANVGTDQSVDEQSNVALSGIASSDSDGSIVSYAWTQVSGSTVTLFNENTATASFDTPVVTVQQGVQTLVFELTVTDNEGVSAKDQVTVLVNPVNAAPVVNAGVDQTVDEQTVVTLNGSGLDTDSGVASYTWSHVSGLPVTLSSIDAATTSFTAPAVLVQDSPATTTLRLTVVDNEGESVSDDVIITINAVNADPIVNAGVDIAVNENSLVNIDATVTDDGSIASYSWVQVGTPTVTLTAANSEDVSFTAPTVLTTEGPQTITLRLTVTDNEGATVSDDVVITVNPVNADPVANAGADAIVNEQTLVTLSATSSTDSDGSIASYQWTQVLSAGQTALTLTGADTATPGFTAPEVLVQDGDQFLTFNVEVTDNEGAKHSDQVVITVQAVNADPVANAGAAQTVNEQTVVNLTAAASSDSDGSIVSYQWTQVLAAGQTALSLTGADTATPSFTAPEVLVQDGDQFLTFNVEVTDNEGANHSDQVVITVQSVNADPVANAGAAQTVNEQTVVNLTAAASSDSDGSIVSYQWTQVLAAGQTALTLTGADTVTPSFTAPEVLVQDGDQFLTFNVEVSDNEGAKHSAQVVITVQAVNADPVANAGAAQTVNEQTVVNLNATASIDSDGSIASYQWTQVLAAGQTALTLTGADTATPSFNAPVVIVQDGDQQLTFNVEVTDNEGAKHSAQVVITVQAVNADPVANAGAAQTVNEQTLVNLSATGSTDADGSIVSYQWTQVLAAGQTPVTLTGATTATPGFTAPEVLVQDGDQQLTFNVEVTDNEDAKHSDQVIITVQAVNVDPVANAGPAQTVNEQTLVNLTAAASTDADGEIASYNWTQVLASGQTALTLTGANTATPSFTAPEVLVQDGDQQLTFNLEVTDNEGAKHSALVLITVQAVNADPVANAGAAQTVNEQTVVNLTAVASSDSDGSIVSYNWTQVLSAGQTPLTLTGANTATPSFNAPVVLVQDGDQILIFNVEVTDNEGAKHNAQVTITVQAVNADPVANAGPAQTVNEQTLVNLNATASSDSDGSIVSYQWTQVLAAGQTALTLTAADTATPSFMAPVVLAQDGDQYLTFNVEVTDNEGAKHNAQVTITVQPVNANPVANAGDDASYAEYTTVTLNGSGSDSDGSISTYQWTQVSGIPVLLSDVTAATPAFVAPAVYQDEVLTFKLIVADNETGVSVADTVNITIYSVNPDDDADGLPDLYEINNYGDLTRDGTGDFDNDGYSDLQEYQDGTNPLALTLAAPTGLNAVAANAQVKLKWDSVTDAVGYNVYWDTVPNVTKDSNVISNVSSDYVHTGLTNGTTYYYVVTSLSAGDESVVSEEVSAVPGKRTWKAPTIVDSATTTYFYPQIAMNRNGQSVVVYEHFDGVAYSAWATMYDKATGWNAAQAIETGDAGHVYNPQVAMDDNGNAIAVWEQFNGTSYNVWANVYDAQSASWGVAEQIETSLTGGSEYFMPQVAMSQSGSAVVTWQKHDSLAVSVWASRYDMATGWTQPVKLETDDLFPAYLPKVDADSTGNATVVWEQLDSTTGVKNIWSSSYKTATGWSPASIISNLDNYAAYDAQVALSDSGRAIAVWEQFDGTRYNVWTNVADNGSWGTAERVEYNTTGTNEYYKPQVAMNNSGNAVVTWQQFDGSHISAWTNRYINGAWEVAQRVEANDLTAITNPKIAMDEDGNAVVAWEQYDDSSKSSLISIWANRFDVSTGWGSAQPLETNDTETMWFPEVAMDAYGNAQATWFHNAATADNILVAENILQTNPPVANAGADQGGFAARDTVTLDASASTDTDGTIVSYHWQQLSGAEVALENSNTVAPSFSAPRTNGNLIFILTVTDNDGLTSSDTVVITVGEVGTTGFFGDLLGNSGKVASHGLASGVMPEQWALNHGVKVFRKTSKGKTKLSSRIKSFSIERDATGKGGRTKTFKNLIDKNK